MITDFIEQIRANAELVTLHGDGHISMKVGGGRLDYEFEVSSPEDALRWIEHLAPKTWCTAEHLGRFASLVADRHCVRYR